jgi:signal transduction histidine kinase
MKICVLSKGLQLFNSCRRAVQELAPAPLGELKANSREAEIDVVLSNPNEVPPFDADLLVWDVDDIKRENCSNGIFAASPTQDQVFVIGRRRAEEFLLNLPLGAGNALLKPVSESTLRSFVEQAATRARSRQASAKAPDADRPDLLHYLLTANLRLQAYDQERTNFLARAVHDFRAPLMAASGYCGLLLEGALGPINSDQLESLTRMQHSLRKLTRMASAMLQLSVGKQVKKKLDLKPSAIETCIHHSVNEIAPLAAEKKISVTLKLSPPESPLFLDPQQIEQVLTNLLENACRFTPKGGQIEVRAYPASVFRSHGSAGANAIGTHTEQDGSNAYRVDISDTGAGIATEHLEAVFEEYTSYSGSQDRSGGGLGLAICKMILTEHGGQVWAENHAAGARLSFVLPLRRPSGKRRSDVSVDESLAKRAAS